jgi:hypothetical protein
VYGSEITYGNKHWKNIPLFSVKIFEECYTTANEP